MFRTASNQTAISNSIERNRERGGGLLEYIRPDRKPNLAPAGAPPSAPDPPSSSAAAAAALNLLICFLEPHLVSGTAAAGGKISLPSANAPGMTPHHRPLEYVVEDLESGLEQVSVAAKGSRVAAGTHFRTRQFSPGVAGLGYYRAFPTWAGERWGAHGASGSG